MLLKDLLLYIIFLSLIMVILSRIIIFLAFFLNINILDKLK